MDAKELYRSFHGVNPRRARKVHVPQPQGPLMKLGTLSQINYCPDPHSQHAGVEFTHRAGDTGERTIRNPKSNQLLATDGKNLFIIPIDGSSQYPFVNERGIIG